MVARTGCWLWGWREVNKFEKVKSKALSVDQGSISYCLRAQTLEPSTTNWQDL